MEVEGSQSLRSWLRKLPFLLIALQLTLIYIPIVTYSRIFTAKNSYRSRWSDAASYRHMEFQCFPNAILPSVSCCSCCDLRANANTTPSLHAVADSPCWSTAQISCRRKPLRYRSDTIHSRSKAHCCEIARLTRPGSFCQDRVHISGTEEHNMLRRQTWLSRIAEGAWTVRHFPPVQVCSHVVWCALYEAG